MLLALDAGNTNITLGLFRDQELIAQSGRYSELFELQAAGYR